MGKMRRTFRAGAGEKMQYMVHAYNDNTIRFVLRYPGLLDEEILRSAVRAVVGSVNVLHASFSAGRFGAKWTLRAQEAMQECFSVICEDGDLLDTAMRQAVLPIAPDCAAQMQCVLVRGKDECALVVRISHLCADGSDGKYLMRKLAEAYCRIAGSGRCEGMHIKNGSRAAQQAYAKLSVAEKLRILKDPRTGIKSVFPFGSAEQGRPVLIRREISAETMTQARVRAKKLGATVNDILLAASYCAYAALPGVDAQAPMSISAMMDLRRHCEGGDSQGLSNMAGLLTTALREGVQGDLEWAIGKIAAQTKREKEDPLAGLYGLPLLHGAVITVPLDIAQKVAKRLYRSMAVGLTNLGELPREEMRMGSALPTEGWFGGPLKQKPGMQVSAMSVGGQCALCVAGCYTQEDEALIRRMLDDMAGRIEQYAKK